jgi:ribosome-binding factor A
MPKNFTRSDRVAQQIQRELAEIIRLELNDPRRGMITLTDVEVTRDLAYAKIFYTLMGGHEKASVSIAALEGSSGFLRSQLARRIKLFKIPELQFIYDESIEHGINLSQLIDQAIATNTDDEQER